MPSTSTIDDLPAPVAQTPPAPQRLSDTGLEAGLVGELIGKTLYLLGNLSLIEIAQNLRLPATVIEDVLCFLRAERVIELLRRGELASDVHYGLTDNGRLHAARLMERCRYVGPAPVTLADYTRQVRSQSFAARGIRREDIERAYKGLIVAADLREQIGAALNSGRPLFFYGPSGSGKTYLAETLIRLMHGSVLVPHAFIVRGEIVQVFDPLIHRPIAAGPASGGLDNRQRSDERWVACARPVAISGGELTLGMLDLQHDPITNFYHAPTHVKANNGLYIIDDLGRQAVATEQLMNRWIVPMDRQRDYLTLHGGSSFEIPFDLKLVFSTNLTPAHIADEAFLRRLGYKIAVGPLSEREYEQIFRSVCEAFAIPFSLEAFTFLTAMHRRLGKPCLACHPRDLLSLLRDYATYRGSSPSLTPATIEQAWHSYFATQA